MRRKLVVAMNGGGTESAVLIPWVIDADFEVVSVFVDGGFPAAVRHRKAAQALAEYFGVPNRVVTVDYGMDLTHNTPGGFIGPQVAWTALLFSIGSGVGAALGAQEVYLGQTFDSHALRRGWDLIFQTTNTVIWRPELIFPLAGVSKHDLKLRPEVWVLTDSCYLDPACGVCAKCVGRQEALRAS